MRSIFMEMRGVLAIAWFYGFLPLSRNILWTLNYIGSPLSFLFLIHLYGGEFRTVYALAGAFVMVTLSTSVSMETEAAFNRIILKFQDIYVASPLKPISYIIGLATANILSAIPGILIFLVLTYLLASPHALFIPALMLSLTSVWITFSTIGFLISTLARDVKDLWTWTPILTIAFSVLPPVFYPAEILPRDVWWVVYLIPSATASRMLQATLGGVSLDFQDAIYLSLGLLAQLAVSVLVLLRINRWRVR